MMRRSRISVKPNFRPGNRTGTEGEQASQKGSVEGDTLLAVKAEEFAKPAPSHQQNQMLKEPSEDVGLKETTEMPAEMNQTDVAPSSGAATSSAATHRRMRISATPKLVRPKLSSTPRSRPSARMPSSAPSPLPNEEHVQSHDSASEASASLSIISNDLPESGTPKKTTSATELPTQPSTTTQSSSLCVPSTSGLLQSPVCGKHSVEDSPPSPQPGQVPQQPPQEPEPLECPSTADLSSSCVKPFHSDKAGASEMSEKFSDKDRILRALKLKELMKIERRKDIQKGKRRVGYKEYTAVDRSKMTMRELIYYLPNTSPMRSSIVSEENIAETVIPPSPKEQIKTTEREEEEEEEGSENEEMLVPKVRVAEDGSIILDEDSLTVRVQRTSNTKVENSALFERGSTTTYGSFRSLSYVKSWSVRETDLFFLAISMVGTDFSLIGQLLTHRSRKAIKSKFKKEERINPWRVDKAFRNKRPFDKEFFSYLLEKVLAKDKDKKKSIKLVLPKTKKARRSKGKTSNAICLSDDDDDDDDIFHMDDHEDLEDDGTVSVEKESEDVSNVKETDTSVPNKKSRKRTRDLSKGKDKDTSTEEQVKRKRQRKCSKKTKEVQSKGDTEGEGNLTVEGDTTNVNKEDELERSTSASKRRRKRSKSEEEKQNKKPVKGGKGKRIKKSLKVVCDHEESLSQHEESSTVAEEGSAAKKKRKRAKNSDLDGDEPVKGKKNTKRKKTLKSTVEEEGTAEGRDTSADLQEAEQINAPVTAEIADKVPPETARRNKKPLPKPARTRSKKRNEPKASAEVENNQESNLMATGSPLEDKRLRMQAVVVLEKTPPRQQYLLSPLKVKGKNNELEPSMSSPASPSSSESSTHHTRMQRAGRAKRDLSTSRKTRRRKGTMDEPEQENPMVLLEAITRESEDEEDDNSLNENLIDLSCIREFDSQMFQRRPMVVLSREEVDMILDASEQSAEEDPSVSPLDLSLNTELSFPFQCSKLLEDNNEEAEVDCMFEEHEESTNDRASREARDCEELGLRESALAQSDISNLRDSSTSLKPEVCSQPEVGLSKGTTSCPVEEAEPRAHPTEEAAEPRAHPTEEAAEPRAHPTEEEAEPRAHPTEEEAEPRAHPTEEEVVPRAHPMALKDVTTVAAVLEACSPLAVLDNVDSICMKPDATVTQETVTTEAATFGTSSVFSHVTEESNKAMLPSLLKESGLASSEITAQSKLSSVRSGLGSQRTLQATSEVKGDLQMSLEGCSQTMETLQDSSESKADHMAQESAMASPELGVRTQGCVVALDVKEDFQADESVQSSASISSEHGIRPARRSRFLKPKPNLSQKSRATVLQNQRQHFKTPSTLNPKSSEPTSSTEKLLYSPANDKHRSLEDFNKQNLTKEEEASQSKAMNQMESKSTKDLCDAPTAVPDQENITKVTLSPTSSEEPQEALECSSSRCDVDMIPPCTLSTSPSQTVEDAGTEQMIVPSENVCAAAENVHLTEDDHSDEEPTFILTLYEIPVSEAYLPSSSNDSAMISDLPTVETQAFLGVSDQAHILPSTSESFIKDPLLSQNDFSVVAKDLSENGRKQISENVAHDVTSPHTKDEDSVASANLEMDIPKLDPHSECKMSSEFAPLDLAPKIHSTPPGFNVSKCITTLPQDFKGLQGERVSHMMLADAFVPVSEDTANKERTVAVESKPTLLNTKDEEDVACENLETGIHHFDPELESKNGSEFAPLEDLASRTQGTSGSNISKCITTLHQNPEDTEQCERVSHMLLADVFVPVSEETGDNPRKDGMAVECKLESSEASTASVIEDLAENVKEQISENLISHEPILLDTKDEEVDACVNLETGIPHLDAESECKNSSEIAPLEDLPSRTQSSPSRFNITKCITTIHQDSVDTEQCGRISHMLLGDVFVPVSEETGVDSSMDRAMAVECKEDSTVSVTEDLAENVKEQISENLISHEPILLDTKDEAGDACVNLETGIPHLEPESECKIGSEIAPLEDLEFRPQSTFSGSNISECITTLHQDSADTEQCEKVSHMLLADVFDPVSEETEDDSSKDGAMAVECKEASTVCLPERQDPPYEELTKVENSPVASNPLLCFESIEESKDTPPLSEETKAPVRRRERQKVKPQPKLVKRTRAKADSSKTDKVVREPSQPTASHAVLPASHEENLPGISNTITEKSGEKMSSSRDKGVKSASILDESPKISPGDLEAMETKPISTALHLFKEPELEEENSKNVIGDTAVKDDMESFAEDKELSILTSNEGANVQPCCEDMHFNLLKSSGSGSSTVDSEETEEETQGVSHMVLPDVFVLVSDETEDDLSKDWTVSIETSPQRVSLPKKAGTHFQKEVKTEVVSQTLVEESTWGQSSLEETKTPVTKRAGKQEVKRTCTKNDSTKTKLSQPTSPQATTSSAQLPTLPQNDNMLLLEEKLQRKHNILPCIVRLSSLDIVAQRLDAPQLEDRKSNEKSALMSSPTSHASVTTVSEESSTPLLEQNIEFEKKSPTRRKGKKMESSPDTKCGHLKRVHTISQTRQLTITDWAKKKSHQTATNQEEKDPVKSSQMQSSLKAKEDHQFMVEKTEDGPKSQHTDPEEAEGSQLVSTLEEVNSVSTEVKRSSEMVKESTEDSYVSQVKKSPARQRAKLQVKPILTKRACTKSEGNTSTTDQPQPTRFTSPTHQRARAAREEESSDNKNKQPVEEVTSTSSMEANSKVKESSLTASGPRSPKSQDIWPRVVLPRIRLWTTEAGVCSASSTPTSSPARLSQSASPPVTPPQLKKSPTQSSSPTANDDDDPARVSQFFLCDIFTEVEEAE